MNEEKKSLLKTLGMVSTMGIAFAVAIAIGVWWGTALDAWFLKKGWPGVSWLAARHGFFFMFLFFGIAAGFRNIFILAGKELRDDGSDEHKRG
jgi:ATP synthase protein I